MKRALPLSLAFVMSTSAFLTAMAQSQSPVGVSVVAGAGGGTTSHLTPGNYNQVTQDNTRLLSEAMAHLSNMQKMDRDYLQEMNNRMLINTKRLIELGSKMRELSYKSQTSILQLDEYVSVVNQIKAADENFSAELQSMSLVSKETLPSQTQVSVGGVDANIGMAGNIDMKPVVDSFTKSHDSILADIRALPIKNVARGEQMLKNPITDSLNPDLSGLVALTKQEVDQKTEKMLEDLALDGKTLRLQRQYVQRMRIDIRHFISAHGTEESFRFRDENDRNAALTEWASLQDAFFRRSYLRRSTGIPQGAIRTVKYDKKKLNLERFTMAFKPLNEYLNMIPDQAAVTREEVLEAFENARNFVQLFDEQLTPIFRNSSSEGSLFRFSPTAEASRDAQGHPVFKFLGIATKEEILSQKEKAKEYSSKDTGFLVRASAAATFLTGRGSTAEVMLAVMRMVLADTREELMLLQNDRAAMQAYSSQRFYSTPEQKTASGKAICQMDFTLLPEVFKKNCLPLGISFPAKPPMGQPGNDISGIFAGLLAQYTGIEKAKQIEAEQIRQLLITAMNTDTAEEQSQQDSSFQ